MRALAVILATFLLRYGDAILHQASGSRPGRRLHRRRGRVAAATGRAQRWATDGQHIKLFCFAFFPRRAYDEELLPESRKQMAACDGYRFFTDMEAPGEAADDIIKVVVPRQDHNRTDQKWLYHRNIAGLAPSWTYLLQTGIVEQFDWAINVELDHFLRPTKVRSTIREMVTMLENGSAWEKGFVGKGNATDGKTFVQPMMFAFGNAFAFNREMIQVMKTQWPLPGMVADAGCPNWFGWCEQDMVYPRMLPHFKPPIQMFGEAACGRQALTETGDRFPLACWEAWQNPLTDSHQLAPGPQLDLIHAIAAQGDGGRHSPVYAQGPAHHIVATEHFMADREPEMEADMFWPTVEEKTMATTSKWDCFFPPKEIPILHHMSSSLMLKDARELLGL